MKFIKSLIIKLGKTPLIILSIITLLPCASNAGTVTYTLENLIQDNAQQMTGTFDWIYTPGDFENGNAVFTDLFIPSFGSDISALNITVSPEELDFSFAANVHSGGVNVNLFLLTPFTETQSALIDPARSRYEIEVGGSNGFFISGSVVPSPVPVPSSLMLLLSGLFAVTGVMRKNCKANKA